MNHFVKQESMTLAIHVSDEMMLMMIIRNLIFLSSRIVFSLNIYAEYLRQLNNASCAENGRVPDCVFYTRGMK